MLNYKQIWHGIKPIRWLNKFNLTINKSPIILIIVENKFDTSDLFTNGKNHRGKTPLGEFKVITPKNLLLSIINSYK